MGFSKLKIKAKATCGRGGIIDAEVVMRALKDYWNDLQVAIEDLPSEE